RQWRYEADYPLARTDWTKLYLSGDALQRGAPIGEPEPRRYKMPESYAQLTAGKPALAYTTPPMDKPLTLWGPVSVTFYASSSQIDTAFFVKLAEVPREGPPRNLSRGILKASFREVDAARSQPGRPFHPFTRQELLKPGEIYEFQIELRPIFHTLGKGQRLQLQISSEDIQYNNPLRQLDVLLLPWPVENAIYADAAHPSHLLLPVVPNAPEIAPVKPPLAEIDWPLTPGSWSPN